MYNKKAIQEALAKLNSAKKPKQEPDIIVDPKGQWNHPGKPTRIPDNNITMEGVPYPVLGIDDLGNQQMMLPGAEYTFPGANYVDEFPMAKYGGLTTGLTNKKGNLLMNNKGKRIMAQSGSLSATNELFLGNPLVTKRRRAVYVPGKSFQEGGPVEAELDQTEIDNLVAQGYVVEDIDQFETTNQNEIMSTAEPEISQPEIISEYGWDYKKENDNFFTRRTGTENWISPKGKTLQAIQEKVYNIPSSNVQEPVSSENNFVSENENQTLQPQSFNESSTINKKEIESFNDGYLPVFKSSDRQEACRPGKGCAHNTSVQLLNLFGSLEKDLEDFKAESLWAQNAWFNRDFQERNGGKVLYNTDQRGGPDKMPKVPKELYSKLQVGDYVHLDRVGHTYDNKVDNESKLNLKNEKLEHIGFIIGKDEDGTPLVWHGSQAGNAYIQRLDENINLEPGGYNYQVASIVRSPGLTNVDSELFNKHLGNNPYYRNLDEEIDPDLKLELNPGLVQKLTSVEKNALDTVNNENVTKEFLKMGYNQEDYLKAAHILIGGNLDMESSRADWSSPGEQLNRKLKETGARVLKNTLGLEKQFDSDEASRGVFQIKPEMNFPEGSPALSKLKQLGIEKDNIFDNDENQIKAAMVLMLSNYEQLKRDPRYDSEKDGIVLDGQFYPSGYMLAKSWQSGIGNPSKEDAWYDRDKHKPYLKDYDTDYSVNALNRAAKLRLSKKSDKDLSRDIKFVGDIKFNQFINRPTQPMLDEELARREESAQANLDWFNNRDDESTSVNLPFDVGNFQLATPTESFQEISEPEIKTGQSKYTRSVTEDELFDDDFTSQDQIIHELPRFDNSPETLEKLKEYKEQGYKLIKKGNKIYVTVKMLPGVTVKTNKQQGGFIELDLTPDEIEQYRKGGFIIEEI